ncbi:hypothetical protein M5E87_07140 [Flavonifractor plautii]|nr:hypothetical protein M5E87_07140 [Flavonifractor plautii]
MVVTTTTHILRHPGLPLVEEPTPERLRAALEGHGWSPWGRSSGGQALRRGNSGGAAPGGRCGTGGGRRGQAPAPQGPGGVRARDPSCTDAVAAVAGMDAVGQAVGAVCHRPERVCALLGAGAEHVLTPADAALLLASPKGAEGRGEAMAFRCVLNKADTPSGRPTPGRWPDGWRSRAFTAPLPTIGRRSGADYAGSD